MVSPVLDKKMSLCSFYILYILYRNPEILSRHYKIFFHLSSSISALLPAKRVFKTLKLEMYFACLYVEVFDESKSTRL